MIEYISPSTKKLSIVDIQFRISINFQSSSVVRNSNKDKIFVAFTFNVCKNKIISLQKPLLQ